MNAMQAAAAAALIALTFVREGQESLLYYLMVKARERIFCLIINSLKRIMVECFLSVIIQRLMVRISIVQTSADTSSSRFEGEWDSDVAVRADRFATIGSRDRLNGLLDSFSFHGEGGDAQMNAE